MKKLLLFTNSIPKYRLSVYNELGKLYDFTVAHYGKAIFEEETNFKQIILHPKKFGPFIFFKENIYKIAKKFNAVLAMGELGVIPYMLLGFHNNRKFSLTFWGGDVSFSYSKHYDEDRRFDRIRFYLMNRADSLAFYCSYPVNRYVIDGGIQRNKLFVAHNTVYIPDKIEIPLEKKYFIFVGTLYKAKKIYDLLNAYLNAYNKNKDLQPLVIVGDGDETRNIKNWINNQNLNNKIELKGAIYDEDVLKDLFRDAISCISPGQAGLSVLSSMAYGVPFTTSLNAITGGEIFNISNDVNGFLYDGSVAELTSIILKLSSNSFEVQRLSNNAQQYYFENATISIMVKGLTDSIEYAMNIRANDF